MREAGAAVLVCAATGWEAGPLVSRLGLRSAGGMPPPAGSILFEGAVSGRPVLLLRTGMGAARTRRSLEAFGSRGSGLPFSCAVSAGLACGLDPALSAGDLVVDLGPGCRGRPASGRPASSELRGEGCRTWESAADEAAKRRGLRLRLGRVAEAGEVLGPGAKAALRSSTGACAADMETGALRTWAEGRGLAVVNARVVLDGAEEELPGGFPDPDDPWALAGSVLRRPHLLPSLLRVGWNVRSGLAGLAGFLEEFLPGL